MSSKIIALHRLYTAWGSNSSNGGRGCRGAAACGRCKAGAVKTIPAAAISPSDRGFCVGSNDKWRSCGKQERESGRAPDIATGAHLTNLCCSSESLDLANSLVFTASPSDVAVQRPSYRVCVTWMNRSGTLRVACWSISSIPRGRTHLRGDLHLRTHALSLSFHCIQFLVVLPASAGRTAPWPEVRLPTPSVRPLSSVPIGVFAYLGIAVAHSRAPYWRRRLRWTVLTAWRLIFPLSRGRLSWSR